MRRGTKTTKTLLKSHKKQILSVIVTALMVSMPMLFYVKFSLENGYKKLISLSSVVSASQAQEVIKSARADFERANFVFLPFSLAPIGPLGLANTALHSGLLVSRALDTIVSPLAVGSGATMSVAKSTPLTPEYRKEAEDIFPLSRF
jgi:hypothetical protein